MKSENVCSHFEIEVVASDVSLRCAFAYFYNVMVYICWKKIKTICVPYTIEMSEYVLISAAATGQCSLHTS